MSGESGGSTNDYPSFSIGFRNNDDPNNTGGSSGPSTMMIGDYRNVPLMDTDESIVFEHPTTTTTTEMV